jgi:DAK2 domain fusion protein YloV
MIISAANNLENNKIAVNSLNVFPVPDGDTGTNMSMTIMSAVKEIQKVKGKSIEVVADAAANGSLMGARGNSGVILSQLFRGFARGVKGKEQLSTKDIAAALKEGVGTAYKAVMKPTEGTILTVAREAADKAVELSKTVNDVGQLLSEVLEYAQTVLDKTPDMLPVLKKAGVVDAGGKGLICIYRGAIEAFKGNDIAAGAAETKEVEKEEVAQKSFSEEEIKFGYCTEFIVKTDYNDIDKFKETLSAMGDSLVVVGGSGIIKVHVHTNNPGKVLSEALSLGELTKIKIDNMREQHRSILEDQVEDDGGSREPAAEEEQMPPQKAAVITVAMGEGIKNIFLDLGASKVIEGGQTMNPSTEDILNAINQVNASDIYILPNNGNIVMAAKQAATLSSKNVFVVPTKSIPQGIAALTVFNPDSASNDNVEMMNSTINYVKTGQVTYAVRNTTFDDKKINEGDILGLVNGKINNTGKNIIDVTEALIDNMVSEDDELITILYGKDMSEQDAEELVGRIQKKYTECDVQSYSGGQPLYYFIISVE